MASNGGSRHDLGQEIVTYTEGAVVPFDVFRVRIDPSVAIIPPQAFRNRPRLREVVLHEGVLEIGNWAFCGCPSLRSITGIPPAIRVIGKFAFANSGLSSFDIPVDAEIILRSTGLFYNCHRLCNARVPPTAERIPEMTFCGCTSLFSLELPDGVNRICSNALSDCRSLRNFAIPSLAGMGDDMSETFGNMFHHCTALQELLGHSDLAKHALLHRFDELPVHRLIYFQSYHPIESTLTGLNEALRGESFSAGYQRDCLGMTPLHILACSKRQNIELFRVLVESDPESLVAEDGWRAHPIFYAVWGDAPREIIQFLCYCHKRSFPNHVLPWKHMVTTLIKDAQAPVNVLRNLLYVHKTYFSDQEIDSTFTSETVDNHLVYRLAMEYRICIESLQYLVHYSTADCLRSIGVKKWRNEITELIESIPDNAPKRILHLEYIRNRIASIKSEFRKLKDYATIMELALWKHRIDENMLAEKFCKAGGRKKAKMDESESRIHCRVTCGADSVIDHVLSYLVPAKKDIQVVYTKRKLTQRSQ